MTKHCTVIGAGLAGSEAAWQLVRRGISVTLHEMRPGVTTKAHKSGDFAELVCSNSFRGASLTNAVGLLKEELKIFGSLIMEAALACEVPAGGALAVDRDRFSRYVSQKLRTHPLITVREGEVVDIPLSTRNAPVIIATGPLTSQALAKKIEALTGHGRLAFFDAISPIVLKESLDLTPMYFKSRYEKGNGDDYLNIPLDAEQYKAFIDAVTAAEKFGGHEEVESDAIEGLRPFEGCMPIEDMAARGFDTLRHGPLKPKGLRHPVTGIQPHAVIQLRQDDTEGNLWSLVGFQTRMKHPEQLRVFRSLPGMQEAEFVRLGSVHRNSFIESPKVLQPTLELRTCEGLFFAGQITGVEGYVESTSGGLLAGINAARTLAGEELITFPPSTAIGALAQYISDPSREYFQPMNISFGIMPSYFEREEGKLKKSGKDAWRLEVSERALKECRSLVSAL